MHPPLETNRHQRAEYNEQRLESVSVLDKIASYFLMAYHSATRKDEKINQGLINNNCSAVVVIVSPESPRTYVFALNKGVPDPQILQETEFFIQQEGVRGAKVVFSDKYQDGTHAEMQLLKAYNLGEIRFAKQEMGVSKPCCAPCSHELQIKGINHTATHNDPVKSWKPPT